MKTEALFSLYFLYCETTLCFNVCNFLVRAFLACKSLPNVVLRFNIKGKHHVNVGTVCLFPTRCVSSLCFSSLTAQSLL